MKKCGGGKGAEGRCATTPESKILVASGEQSTVGLTNSLGVGKALVSHEGRCQKALKKEKEYGN